MDKVKYKICGSCKKLLEISNFYKMKNSKDGFQCHCIECKKAYIKNISERNKHINYEGYKVCSCCHMKLKKVNFNIRRSSKDGLRGICKSCERKQAEMRKKKIKINKGENI